ncbi:hypothetical protein LXL04_009675 [Taraxacum kok-saghyz]
MQPLKVFNPSNHHDHLEPENIVPVELPQVQEAATASELMEAEAEEAMVAVDMEAEVEQPKVSEMMETNDDGNDNRVISDMEQFKTETYMKKLNSKNSEIEPFMQKLNLVCRRKRNIRQLYLKQLRHKIFGSDMLTLVHPDQSMI